MASSPSSFSDPPNETNPPAPEEGRWSSQVNSTRESSRVPFPRPRESDFLPPGLVRGGGNERSVRGRITSFKESDPRAQRGEISVVQ